MHGLRSAGRTLLITLSPSSGFFSSFNCVVNHLHHSLGRRGIEAVRVEWRASESPGLFPYGTPDDGNLWNLFFEPLEFERYPDTLVRTDRYADDRMTNFRAYRHVYDRPARRREYHRAFTRHIRLKPDLRDKIDDFYETHLRGRFAVGVHYRNARHSVECPERIPGIREFVRRTRALIDTRPDARVFLATDVDEAVDAFRDAFGDRLVCQAGVVRARCDGDQHTHHNPATGSRRLGDEVVIDTFLLARCDVLLHVTSNVATAAAYINPDLRLVYCEHSRLAGLGAYAFKRLEHLLIRQLPFVRLLSPETRQRLGRVLARRRSLSSSPLRTK